MSPRRHRVFLDSNVILSGLFSDRGAPRLLLDVLSLELPVLVGLTGAFNLAEIERNLGKRMADALSAWRYHIPKLHLEIIPMPSPWDVALLGDIAERKDLPVIASAINGKADIFVSGDKPLLARVAGRTDIPFRAWAPAEFLSSVLPGLLGRKG